MSKSTLELQAEEIALAAENKQLAIEHAALNPGEVLTPSPKWSTGVDLVLICCVGFSYIGILVLFLGIWLLVGQ